MAVRNKGSYPGFMQELENDLSILENKKVYFDPEDLKIIYLDLRERVGSIENQKVREGYRARLNYLKKKLNVD